MVIQHWIEFVIQLSIQFRTPELVHVHILRETASAKGTGMARGERSAPKFPR